MYQYAFSMEKISPFHMKRSKVSEPKTNFQYLGQNIQLRELKTRIGDGSLYTLFADTCSIDIEMSNLSILQTTTTSPAIRRL